MALYKCCYYYYYYYYGRLCACAL